LRAVGVTPSGMEADIATGEEMAAMNQPGVEGMTGPGAAPPAAGPGAPGTL